MGSGGVAFVPYFMKLVSGSKIEVKDTQDQDTRYDCLRIILLLHKAFGMPAALSRFVSLSVPSDTA